MKATEQYFPVVLFITLYKVVLSFESFESVDEILKCYHSKLMKATEQYFPVVPFIFLYKVVLCFEPVDESIKCDHANESYWAVLKKLSHMVLFILLHMLIRFIKIDIT